MPSDGAALTKAGTVAVQHLRPTTHKLSTHREGERAHSERRQSTGKTAEDGGGGDQGGEGWEWLVGRTPLYELRCIVGTGSPTWKAEVGERRRRRGRKRRK